MSRPFSIGDLVVLRNGFTGRISSSQSAGYILVVIGSTNYQVMDCEIKTIRKPREGSKDSRAIVAMLARRYHKTLSNIIGVWLEFTEKGDKDETMRDYWTKRKGGAFNTFNENCLCYLKAKAMIKESK